MTAQTIAQRQAELKARRIAAGLKQVTNLWAHPEDFAPIRGCAKELAERRDQAARRKAINNTAPAAGDKGSK